MRQRAVRQERAGYRGRRRSLWVKALCALLLAGVHPAVAAGDHRPAGSGVALLKIFSLHSPPKLSFLFCRTHTPILVYFGGGVNWKLGFLWRSVGADTIRPFLSIPAAWTYGRIISAPTTGAFRKKSARGA